MNWFTQAMAWDRTLEELCRKKVRNWNNVRYTLKCRLGKVRIHAEMSVTYEYTLKCRLCKIQGEMTVTVRKIQPEMSIYFGEEKITFARELGWDIIALETLKKHEKSPKRRGFFNKFFNWSSKLSLLSNPVSIYLFIYMYLLSYKNEL